MTERYVIVGAGQAAIQAAATLRQQGFAGEVVLIGDESLTPYQRPPLSKKYLMGELTVDRLLLKPAAFYENARIDLRLDTRVTRIHRTERMVEFTAGVPLSYDKLLLATGSRGRRLARLRPGLTNVHYLRSVQDSGMLGAALRRAGRVAVIGGGYIGLEVAAVAREAGLEVDVIEAAPRVLARATGTAVSDSFTALHERHGVRIRTNASVIAVTEESGRATALVLGNGETVPLDLVVVGIGTIPNAELAAEAGLEVKDGIAVDTLGRTSDPVIFAAGDCTSHPSGFYGRRIRLESVHNAIEQAKAAAAVMCGGSAEYDQVPWFWSDQYDVKFQAVGLNDGHDDVEIEGGGTRLVATYRRDGEILAVEAINMPAAFMAARRSMSACSTSPIRAKVPA